MNLFTKIPRCLLWGLLSLSLLFTSGKLSAQEKPQGKFGDLTLRLLDTYESGVFDEGAAEIPAYDPVTKRLFVTNSNDQTVDVLDLTDPESVQLLFTIEIEDVDTDGAINSVAVGGGLVAIAIDLETDPGLVAFYDTDMVAGADPVKIVEVGSLPDMVAFTADNTKLLVANEGEPADDGSVDPEGSISIIDISDEFSVMTADFSAWEGKANELRAKGVRIMNDTVPKDLEPEYLAISPDQTTAFVTLQENNAFAVVDIATATVKDIIPLGYKDYSKSVSEQFAFPLDFGPLDAEQGISSGGLSGLFFKGQAEDGAYEFAVVPDRGPNGNMTDVKLVADSTQELAVRPFLIPSFQPSITIFSVGDDDGEFRLPVNIPLKKKDGSPLTGLPNIRGVDEIPVVPVDASDMYNDSIYVDGNGIYYDTLGYDAYGADTEGIVINPNDGTFWTVDEYRPSIYHFGTDGTLIERYVPKGTAALATPAQAEGTYGVETLPEEYSKRRANRGFEAIALDTDEGILYAFIQTPLANPDRATSDNSNVIRILGIDPANGEPVAEYVYLLEKPKFSSSSVDKIGDAVYDARTKRFYVIERDSGLDPTSKKFIFEIDLKYATNLLEEGAPMLMAGMTLEQHTPDMLAEQGIKPAFKHKVLNLPSLGYLPSDKPEGLAILPQENALIVVNDNDFGLEPGAEQTALGVFVLDGEETGFDASDKDGYININNWPVYGMYQPDAIAAFEAKGSTYYITANEGDARDYDYFSEEVRVDSEDYEIDEEAYPNASELLKDYALGRMRTTTQNGDLDGDGKFERIFGYGARSFTIWDEYGNIAFESGNLLEKLIAEELPDDFNSTNDENGSFDNRSDDKGPEPEGVTVGSYLGKTYAFIGLERVGGIIVIDVTNPIDPEFVGYVNNRDFDGDAAAGTAGDLGPEGLIFIDSDNSPNGKPILVVTNEVSGSTSIYGVSTVFEDEVTVAPPIKVEFKSRYETKKSDGNAEITAFDAKRELLYVLNSTAQTVDIVNLSTVAAPDFQDSIDMKGFGGDGITSVAVKDGLVAVSWVAPEPTDPGKVFFFDSLGTFIDTVTVGALPDMVVFMESENKLLVANEGEPNDDYTIDPEGSVSIIDVSAGFAGGYTSKEVKFVGLDKQELIEDGVRIFGPNATPAQDLEPEFITIDEENKVAYVSLQENNAVAVLGLVDEEFFDILPLGYKKFGENYAQGGYGDYLPGMDASDRDGTINIRNWPVSGMYQPDAIASYTVNGTTYIVSANEGDARDYNGFSEEVRVKDLELNRDFFDQEILQDLQNDENLGRLRVTNARGDRDFDGEFEKLFAFGARSFSIWDGETGEQVYDSGDDFEQISKAIASDIYNSNRGGDSPDSRSDDKASEPEGVVIGEVDGRQYAFIGLERQGGLMVYDITNPGKPQFILYERSTVPVDDSPEGLIFIPQSESPSGNALVIVSYEESATVSVFEVNPNDNFEVPVAPDTISAVALGSRRVEVTWSNSDSTDSQIGYVLERSFDGQNFNELAVISSNKTRYEDFEVGPGNRYYYRVKAVKGSLASDYSIFDPVDVKFQLHIVHNNDAESQLLNAGTGQSAFFGSVSRFATVVQDLRETAAEVGNGFVMLSSGDNFLAGPEFNASLSLDSLSPYYDALAIAQIGYDALCLGNHDFDFGPDVLEKFIKDTEIQRFFYGEAPVFLSANLDFSEEDSLEALVNRGRIASSTVINTMGEQIGVIGLTTPNLPFISTPREVIVNDELQQIVQAEIDLLTIDGVDKIILISHLQGLNEEIELAGTLSGVDVIIAGGGDDLLANEGDELLPGDEIEGPYPTIAQDAIGEDVYLVTTSGEYKYVGQLLLEFSEEGKVESISDESGPIAVSPSFEKDRGLVREVEMPVIEHLRELAENVIATNEVNLDGVRNNVRSIETNEGNLIADAMLWQANQIAGVTDGFEDVPKANVAIQNGGGIRNNNIIEPGDFTELNTFDILPFSNFVSVVPEISAEQFKDIMENAVSKAEDVDNNSGTGRFAQISGFHMTWIKAGQAIGLDDEGNVLQEGNRVIELTLDDGTPIVVDGALVENAPSVNIAIADFSARGGDQYPFRGADFTPLGVSYQQALFNFIVADTVNGGLGGVIATADYPEGGEGRINFCDSIPTKPTVTSTLTGEVEYTLVSSAMSGNQWYEGDEIIEGAEDNTLIVSASGDYYVKVISGTCESEASDTITICIVDAPTIASTETVADLEFTLVSSVEEGNQWFKNSEEISGATNDTLVVTESGNYAVKLVGDCISTLSEEVEIDICSLEQPTITFDGTDGESAEFKLISSSAEGNQWYKDGTLISGATGQEYLVTESGSYSVEYTIDGCTSPISEPFAVTSLDRTALLAQSALSIYPNPTRGNIKLVFDNAKVGKANIATLYNVSGKFIESKQFSLKGEESIVEFDLSDLGEGLYFIHVKGGDFDIQKKIIKQ